MQHFTLEAIALTRKYGEQEAVNNVSFTLKRGEVLGFLGPNGAGKSTTMKMLTGNLAPTFGTIKICGIDLMEHPNDAKALIGYLPEQRPLYKEFTLDEYLTIAARLHRINSNAIRKSVENAKHRCGLSHMGKRLIENLSNGYQQRVGIAQAIIHNPMVVILDEPTVGLDPIQVREIRALIREIGHDHSVIISTHILPEVEMICDQVQIIDQGKLVFNGSIDVLKKRRMSNTLLIGFKNPPEVQSLLKIESVTEVDVLDNGMIRVQFSQESSPANCIVQASVQNKWGLYQIVPEQTSMEDIFVQLTFQEQITA